MILMRLGQEGCVAEHTPVPYCLQFWYRFRSLISTFETFETFSASRNPMANSHPTRMCGYHCQTTKTRTQHEASPRRWLNQLPVQSWNTSYSAWTCIRDHCFQAKS